MEAQTLQKAARAAFSAEDWTLLSREYSTLQNFTNLSRIEDVEKFVFDAYDRLRNLRERESESSGRDRILGEREAGLGEGVRGLYSLRTP